MAPVDNPRVSTRGCERKTRGDKGIEPHLSLIKRALYLLSYTGINRRRNRFIAYFNKAIYLFIFVI